MMKRKSNASNGYSALPASHSHTQCVLSRLIMIALHHTRGRLLRAGLSSAATFSSTAARLATPDGYLHKTVIPTSHFQDSLPKLPVPELKDTMERMIASAEPLATPDEMEELRSAVDSFMGTDGTEGRASGK